MSTNARRGNNFKDETGNRYGKLLVIEQAGSDNAGKAKWKCGCDCGIETIVRGPGLRTGNTKSCGCAQMENARTARSLTKEEKFKRKYKARECSRCRIIKEPNCFPKDGRRRRCLECSKEVQGQYIKGFGGYGPLGLFKKYGVRPKDYTGLRDKQNGKCAICFQPDPDNAGRPLSVDHDHSMPRGLASVRGLLCRQCNIALGLFRDDISILNSAINYLEDFRKKKLTIY